MELKVWKEWQVEELIGEGAYGKVYKITRTDGFGHEYDAALKVIRIPQSPQEVTAIIHDGMDEKSARDYFHDMVRDIVEEYALLSQFKGHTNIVSCEDHAVISDENQIGWDIYIRMELLTPLYSFQKDHGFTVRDVIRLGIDICKALEVCQKYNITHRDIKPENIFVSRFGDFKLGDFGIAREMEKTMSGLSKKGTYSYMAPEVYKGQPYNSTVDTYSLGIVLYKFLNNNRGPFMPEYPNVIRYSDKEKANVLRMSGEAFPKPCCAEGRLGEIILKACSYNPKDRYESAREMRLALEEVDYTEAESNLIYKAGDGLAVGISHTDYASSVSMEASSPEKAQPEESIEAAPGAEGVRMHTMAEDAPDTADVSGEEGVPTALQEDELDPEQEEKTVYARHESVSIPDKKKFWTKTKLAILLLLLCLVGYGGGNYLYEKSLERIVPDITKVSYADAKMMLGKQDLTIEKEGEDYSSVEKGQIISQSVKADEVVKKGDVVKVIVSLGEKILAPSVVNKTTEEAQGILLEQGIEMVIAEEQYSDSVEKGVVLSQSPESGTHIKEGESVKVTVSKGKHKIKVPDVVGKTTDEAKKTIEDLGLTVATKEEYNADVNVGVVFAQSVEKGKKVEKKTKITITVSKGAAPVVKKKTTTSRPKKKKSTPKKKSSKVTTWNVD